MKTYFCGSSLQRCSIKKGVLKNFTKFAGKHLCQSFFFNKVAGLSPATLWPATLLKKGPLFSCEFCEIFKNIFFTEHLRMTASTFAIFIPCYRLRSELVILPILKLQMCSFHGCSLI